MRWKLCQYKFLVIGIGLVIVLFGYFVFRGKAPVLLDYFLKQGVSYQDEISLKFFGAVIMIAGIVVALLPLLLGVENMNL
ncbi:hypothetical protein [Alkalihalobacillus pseudalcaliphilus]|uniref:hypothetical protein n=1 Tax=Alkalihalobacillus pseudalcaliphilus TaxID=79884 RepID=UPI00064DC457|nr:hypothetical protein [Alkalihalobacillus pseudalcaliphilus]KMK75547.1 hypothetical protein AB990_09625 [Alkalihalobacillus pseudalcaliphilus]